MSGKQYLKNQLPVILINLLGMLALALFLIASDNPIQTVLFILAVWSIVLVLSLLAFYFSRKKYLNKLLNMTEQLEERYLLPEIMQVPERADEQVFYQIMKMAEKSMLERIGEVQRERREYKEYIEQWIHEVKTPITAMKLLCENNRSPFSREVLAELENINQYTEQRFTMPGVNTLKKTILSVKSIYAMLCIVQSQIISIFCVKAICQFR